MEQPQKLPLETILEEDSIIKKATPPKTGKIKPRSRSGSSKPPKKKESKGSAKKPRSRSGSNKPRPSSGVVKAKKPARNWQDLTDAERKVAEADVYLQKLSDKQEDILNQKFLEAVMSKDMAQKLELSQFSSWTGDEPEPRPQKRG